MKRFVVSLIFILIFSSCEDFKDILTDDFDVTKIECGIDNSIQYPENIKRNSNDCPVDTLCNGKNCVENKCDELTISKCNDQGKKCNILTGECIETTLFCTDFDTPQKIENQCGLDNTGFYYNVCKDWNWEKSTSCENIDIEEYNCENGCIYNKCIENKETASNISCGLNNAGTEKYVCTNGDWVLKECDDPDECVNGEKKPFENSCGPNNSGTQKKICENGQWIDYKVCDKTNEICFEGCTYTPTCEDGETKNSTTVCGFNNEGFLIQKCENKKWVDTTECTGTDECENNTEQTVLCGLNELGEQKQICSEGKWEDEGICNGDDVCLNGEEQLAKCGFNNNGDKAQKCEIGQWVDISECTDPDECVNETEETILCGLNGRGTFVKTCVSGKWNQTSCIDPDECVDNSLGLYELCMDNYPITNQNGYAQNKCVSGQWNILNQTCNPIESKMIGADATDDSSIILTDNSNNIYIVGNINCDGNTENCKYKIYKYDNNLILLKSSSESGFYAKIKSAVLDGNGGIIVVGYNYANNRDLLIERYETTNLTKTHFTTSGTLKEDVLTDVYAYKKPNNTYEYYAVGYTMGEYIPDSVNSSPENRDLFYIKLTFELINENIPISKEYQLGVDINNGKGDIIPSKILVDDNYVYISGYTNGKLEQEISVISANDLFFIKINQNDKSIEYKKQFSTNGGDGFVHGMKFDKSIDKEFIYLAGYYLGNINGITTDNGDFAPYLMKIKLLDNSFTFKTIEDTNKCERNYGFFIDSNNFIYMIGYTDGNMPDNQNYTTGTLSNDKADIFITKLTPETNKVWTKQLGTEKGDEGNGVVVDSEGNVFIVGKTRGELGGSNMIASWNIFISKLSKRLICTIENNQECE